MMNEIIHLIKDYESFFSANQYDGSGEKPFLIEEGSIPIMVSAPHAVNHFREGQVKWADMYTGGIARHLHIITGCHLICSTKYTESDPNYDEPEANQYQKDLKDYLSKHKVYLLLDIHGASKKREYAVEMGTVPKHNLQKKNLEDSSLHGYDFIVPAIQEVMERNFRNCNVDRREVWKNRIFDAGHQNTITKYISENTDTACIQLEINRLYRDPQNEREFMALVDSMIELIERFNMSDWDE